MRLLGLRFHHTYRLRIFLALSLTVVLATSLLVTAIFAWLRLQTIKDVERIQLNTLHGINSVFSSYIKGFKLSAREAYSDRYASVLLQRPEKNWISFAVPYSQHLRTILVNNTYIHSIVLFDHKGFIMNTQREAISDDSGNLLLSEMISQGRDLLLLNARHMVYGYNIPIISIVEGERNLKGSWNQGVVINIDEESLCKVLFDGSDNSLMILDSTGRVILSQDKSLFGLDMMQGPNISKILRSKRNEISFTEMQNSQNMLVCAVSDASRRYFIVSTQPLHGLLSSQTAGRDILLLFGGLVLVISLLVSFDLSRRMARPVNELVTDIVQLTTLESSEMKIDELSLAHAALNRTMQMVRSLRVSHRMEQQLNCMMGIATEESERDLFESNSMTKVILLQLDGKDSADDCDMLSIQFISETIGILLHDVLCNLPHVVLPVGSENIAIVLTSGSDAEDLPFTLQKVLKNTLGVSVSISESDARGNGNTRIHTLYLQAMQRMRYRVLMGSGLIMTGRKEGLLKEGAFSEETKSKVLDSIRSGDMQSLHIAIENLMEEAAGCTFDSSISQLCEVCCAAASLIQKPGRPETSYPKIYKTLLLCKSRQELSYMLWTNFERILQQLSAIRQLQGSNVIHQALEYIKKNYMNPELSVKMVAMHFDISVSHFSHMFKEQTGVTFPAYVNRIRLEKACTLLKSKHNATVAQIAQNVGFYSSSYFTAAFRKQFGVPPLKAHLYEICRSQISENDRKEEVQ